MAHLGVQTFAAWSAARHVQATHELPRSTRKSRVRAYLAMEVDPSLAREEMRWRARETSRHPPRGQHTAMDAALRTAAPASAIRAWAQFRLQGRLTDRGGPARCPQCGERIVRDGLHHLSACANSAAAAALFAEGTEWAGAPPAVLLTSLRAGLHLEAGLAVAAALARADDC